MALLRVDVISKALDMATSFMAVLPDEGDLQKTRVVYLLHGLTDNCSGWTRYTSCERYAREHGVALIMPEGAWTQVFYLCIPGAAPDGASDVWPAAGKRI